MIQYRSTLLKENTLSPVSPLRMFYTEMGSFPIHWHECIEIIFVLDGSISIKINDITYDLTTGDILIINSRDLHSFDKPDSERSRLFLLQIEPGFFTKNTIEKNLQLSPVKLFDKKKIIRISDGEYVGVSYQLKRIISEFNEKSDTFQYSVSCALLEILLIFIRLKDSKNSESVPLKKMERLRSVLDFVSTNYMKKITLEDAARSANFSPYHFSRIFKKYTGQTFFEYLESYRINYATYLLVSTEESITDIAFQCGYSNLKTFNRQFRKIEGNSPSNYRKESTL